MKTDTQVSSEVTVDALVLLVTTPFYLSPER
jgi:hypothetical protein